MVYKLLMVRPAHSDHKNDVSRDNWTCNRFVGELGAGDQARLLQLVVAESTIEDAFRGLCGTTLLK